MIPSQMIDGNEFLLPMREEPRAHQCVCLLAIKVCVMVNGMPTNKVGKDKCHAMVASPDQAFCDSCEANLHHLSDNQLGEVRNIHRKGEHA